MPETKGAIPDAWRRELAPCRDRLAELLLGLSQVRLQESLALYQRGLVSFGRAAEVARLPEAEVGRHAAAFGIVPRDDEQTVMDWTSTHPLGGSLDHPRHE